VLYRTSYRNSDQALKPIACFNTLQLDSGETLQHGRYIVRYKLHKPPAVGTAVNSVHAWTHTAATATKVITAAHDIGGSSSSGVDHSAWCEAGSSSSQRDWTEAYRGKAGQCTIRGLRVNKEYDVACCIQNEVCITIL
jgi:hypothetical protein